MVKWDFEIEKEWGPKKITNLFTTHQWLNRYIVNADLGKKKIKYIFHPKKYMYFSLDYNIFYCVTLMHMIGILNL